MLCVHAAAVYHVYLYYNIFNIAIIIYNVMSIKYIITDCVQLDVFCLLVIANMTEEKHEGGSRRLCQEEFNIIEKIGSG